MTFNRFAAGKKVYGQGSYAPTKGQVNPQGYIQREVERRNKQALANRGGVSRVGNDGQSDTRSGLAARALRDNRGLKARAVQGKPVATVRNSGGGNSQRPKTRTQQTSGNPVSTTAVAPVGPTVNINPTGQLELPYGSEYANQVLDAQMQYDAELLAMQEEEQSNDLAYQSNMRDLDYGYKGQQRNTLNDNAASGTAFSSAYGVGVNEDSRSYMNAKNDMDTSNTNFKTNIKSRRNQASSALHSLIQRAQQAYADQLAQDAANYGADDAYVDSTDSTDPTSPSPVSPTPNRVQPNRGQGWGNVRPNNGGGRGNNNGGGRNQVHHDPKPHGGGGGGNGGGGNGGGGNNNNSNNNGKKKKK